MCGFSWVFHYYYILYTFSQKVSGMDELFMVPNSYFVSFFVVVLNAINQLPYSPDMALADFFFFPKLKLPLRDTRFHSIED